MLGVRFPLLPNHLTCRKTRGQYTATQDTLSANQYKYLKGSIPTKHYPRSPSAIHFALNIIRPLAPASVLKSRLLHTKAKDPPSLKENCQRLEVQWRHLTPTQAFPIPRNISPMLGPPTETNMQAFELPCRPNPKVTQAGEDANLESYKDLI